MKTVNMLVFLLIVLPIFGCAKKVVANISDSRKAYILSQPHGFVEIEFVDNEIPSKITPKDLTPEEAGEWKPSPPSCHLVVYLNNEKFLFEDIFPFGQSPPYFVETGFRFPAPIGAFVMEIYYAGCDVEPGEDGLQATSKKLSVEIDVMEGFVTPVYITGDSITMDPQRADTVVTLDDIYKRLDKLTLEKQ